MKKDRHGINPASDRMAMSQFNGRAALEFVTIARGLFPAALCNTTPSLNVDGGAHFGRW